MEILILVLVAVAVPLIVVGAKRGAEAAQRDREQRWGGFPGGLPEPYSSAGIHAGAGAHAPGAEGRMAAPPTPGRSVPVAPGTAAPPAAAPSSEGPRRPGLRALLRPRDDSRPEAEPDRPRAPAPPRRGASTQRPQPAVRRTARSSAQGAVAPPRPTRAGALPQRPPIDINRAPVTELQSLPGVGVRAAERIVAHRERNGDFVSVSDLVEVEGFDEHRVSRLAPRATV